MKTNNKENSKDPVQVYCRLRPLKNLTELAAVRRYSDSIIQLYHPSGLKPETYYNFKFVFPENASQKEVFEEIAYPLVEDLLNGKDGLLFTYGQTSSGKTYTLTGNSLNPGILPRTLDVLFNTIKQRQARKFVFKPDGSNHFEIQANTDALIDLQREKADKQRQLNIAPRTPTRRNKNNNNDEYKEWNARQKDDSICELSEENNNLFAVFVSYIEIYNNYIYDLLDDKVMDQLKVKQPQSKVLREDLRKRVFVLGGVEIEVKSADEATELFIKGINRRRIAHTALNAESSRSHSVFNIKIVQAARDTDGEVVQDSKFMTVSQLSLVDLAGSERAGRTKTTGDRLREASSINNSLMALRNCIDVLRENQRQNQKRIVPFRDNKLTHLFKSYFEGQGSIKMTICVNPSADDYDETIHVMKFAEATQEVMVKRADNMQFVRFDLLNFNNFNVNYPSTEFNDINDEKIFPEWFTALDERKKNREMMLALFKEKSVNVRNELARIDKNQLFNKQRAEQLENDLKIREQTYQEVVARCASLQSERDHQTNKVYELESKIRNLERKLVNVECDSKNQKARIEQMKCRYRDHYQEKIQEMKKTFQEEQKKILRELEQQKCLQKGKMQLVENILKAESLDNMFKLRRESLFPNDLEMNNQNDLNSNNTDKQTPQSTVKATRQLFESKTDQKADPTTEVQQRQSRKRPAGTPVANAKHRRSLSTGQERWIDHNTFGKMDLGTAMSPNIKNKKSVSDLRKLSTHELRNSSGYALTHFIADKDGGIETQVYKGDIIPTCTGGAQIVYNDIETLKQTSPVKSNNPQSYDIGII